MANAVQKITLSPSQDTLLQAIARVNRTAAGKAYGPVDTCRGDRRRIADTPDMFLEDVGVGRALRPLFEKVQMLESRYRVVIRLFEGADRKDDATNVDLLREDDVRAGLE